jgi:hypothetical protein
MHQNRKTKKKKKNLHQIHATGFTAAARMQPASESQQLAAVFVSPNFFLFTRI